MQSIKQIYTSEYIISKSKFIHYLFPLFDMSDIDKSLEQVKKEFPDATHHTYAYIFGHHQEQQKYNDDGEPNQTAGLPMLDILKKHNLTNVLSVSIRYFGGIKLGAGGLVRAYRKSLTNCLEIAKFTYLDSFSDIECIVDFDQIGTVEKFIRDHFEHLDVVYDHVVHYLFTINSTEESFYIKELSERTNGKAQIKILNTYEAFK